MLLNEYREFPQGQGKYVGRIRQDRLVGSIVLSNNEEIPFDWHFNPNELYQEKVIYSRSRFFEIILGLEKLKDTPSCNNYGIRYQPKAVYFLFIKKVD